MAKEPTCKNVFRLSNMGGEVEGCLKLFEGLKDFRFRKFSI